jgi:hypothetical protein
VKGETKSSVLALYRREYLGFGPTLASEKLAERDGEIVAVRTLREWLLADGLWTRQRRRDKHRQRRERRACFGELVQADASDHDWLEGRGPKLALVGMIDDATGRIIVRFYPAETTQAYMDLLGRWIGKYGRPLAWYSDRHGIFRAEETVPGYDEKQSVSTQFSRGLDELAIELILANSPQAKGRIERLWNTAQDRLVKELRLAGAGTIEQANEVVEGTFEPWFNRKCTVKAVSENDAHRAPIKGQELSAVLSIQHTRTVSNDYTIRFDNQFYQLLPPVQPGERGGQVIVEQRLDGELKIRFKERYLSYKALGALPPNPRSLALEPIPAVEKAKGRAVASARPPAVHRSTGRSGRTPALPCPPGDDSCDRTKESYRPAPGHPWRQPVKRQADILICRN